ncbi:Flp pilus assembly protein CpaB [Aeromicrobium terrae]|uniref:Flp pilus assembly protein CpaB n=1 Tax=Aeromicrobium terrae TaxID=2498846 RepID=A0A5C8NM49_9ACTN|nr:Flp pilus assembly protein CpaB [Aeromicrobium terrae]TXL61995.1 Flp pilus assembly protein CpaB [Aeromicrobium terrae]
MNPRQRRGVIFMLLAGLTALILFFVAVNYVSSVNAKVSPTVTVYQAAKQIDAYSVVDEGDLEAVKVPKKWTSPETIDEKRTLVGRRVSFNVAKGTYLGTDMLLPPSSLNRDEREIALTVDAKTGIAGRVRSGDFVDVYAVFGEDAGRGASRVLVRGVRVVSVRGIETRSETSSRDELEQQQVIPVTLALKPTAALAVTYADAFAKSVRLVGLPPEANAQNRSSERSSIDADDLSLPGGGG